MTDSLYNGCPVSGECLGQPVLGVPGSRVLVVTLPLGEKQGRLSPLWGLRLAHSRQTPG